MTEKATLKAPFPYFGGKSRVASLVWSRFGDVMNYVEPFAGSLAVLLARPFPPRQETVNDADCYISNFWRALQGDPDGVAFWADWPVNEADLHARHLWLVRSEASQAFRERMKSDPEYYDAKVAGWWVWGISQWIGSGWCVEPEWRGRAGCARADRGIHSKRPNLHRGSRGIHREDDNLVFGRTAAPKTQIPCLTGARGVVSQKLPNLSSRSCKKTHKQARSELLNYMGALSDRLRRVRVVCGDWSRVVTPSVTVLQGVTAVFLDPPYSQTTGRDMGIYAKDCGDVATAVREWAIANGTNTRFRIALCGYEGEHPMPSDWIEVPWKANGGYGNQSPKGTGLRAKGRENAERERIWFSPYCINPEHQPDIFSKVIGNPPFTVSS